MARRLSLTAAQSRSRPRVIRDSTVTSAWSLEQRLATAERELRVQFTRIAQLQAELDLVLAVVRRWPGEFARQMDDR